MGPLISLFWISGDNCSGFQGQDRAHRFAVYARDSSGSPLSAIPADHSSVTMAKTL